MALIVMLRLILITLLLPPIAAMPYPPADQSPALNSAKKLFARATTCLHVECRMRGASDTVCFLFGCGKCGTNGRCLEVTIGQGDYDGDDEESTSGGGGTSSSGDTSMGSNDSVGDCADTGETISQGSYSAETAASGNRDTASSGTCPVKGTKVNVKFKAQCSGTCDTQFASTCGPGCGCTFAGTGLLGGKDGKCQALAFFGGKSNVAYSKPP